MLGPEFDETLVAARAGSRAALARLYTDLQPGLLGYLRARRPADAEDLASEVWVNVATGLPSFDGDESGFRGWIFTIARRRVVDAHRRARRQRTDPVPVERLLQVVADSDPEADALASAGAEALELLDGLPRDQADVVLLRVVAGLTVDEAAHAMDKRPGTIRVLQHRALRRLAIDLERRRTASEVPDQA